MKQDYYLLSMFAGFLICCFACDKENGINDEDEHSDTIDVPIDTGYKPVPIDTADWPDAVKITYNGQMATITNPYLGKGVVITQVEADIVVTSTTDSEIQYVLTGSTTKGSLKIYSQTQFELIMNGVDIVNSNDPALNIQSTKRATITLYEGTSNRLAGGISFVSEGKGEDMKAAMFSEGALVFSGPGSLEVNSRYRHAICSDEYISIDDGHITIPMSARDGIHTNNFFRMNGGTLDIKCYSDGIDSEGYVIISGGTIRIETSQESGHGIKASAQRTVANTGNITVNGGEISIKAPGLDSEGMKCKANLVVNDGIIEIESNNDGMKVTTSLTINGGSIYCYSETNDGIDSDGPVTINGGTIVAVGTSTQEGFDCSSSAFKITGGTVLGIASLTTMPSATASTQRSFIYTGNSLPQNTVFSATSKDGKNILTYLIPRVFSTNMTILFSSPELQNGAAYTITSGGNITGETSFHGLYNNATVAGGTTLAEFTVSSMVVTVR